MRGVIALSAILLLGACVSEPLARDSATLSSPTVIGKWRAVAIDGVPLGERDAIGLTVDLNELYAVTCNTIGGGYRLDRQRIVRTGPWRETERGCFDPSGKYDPMAFETRVFAILGGPLTASNPTPNTLRLQGNSNRIDFVRSR